MELLAQRAPRFVGAAFALLAALLGGLALAAPASAQLKFPPSQTKPPPAHTRTAREVIRIADRNQKVIDEKRKRGVLRATAYTNGPGRWQVSYFEGRIERVQLAIDDQTGWVLEAWTGPQVAWRMARGESGAFAGKVNAPYVWIPLCVLFFLPFFDWRRPFRLLHLDLLVLLGFGASHFFFNRGDISTSVPLAYPVLLYLLARMVWIGFRPRERLQALVPRVPLLWLGLALVFLVGFRVALNVVDSSVIDVGYAGVIGADRITHGKGLYDGKFPADNGHGDTYGPINYVAYIPFELAFPWKGKWDDLPAAHAAAIAFDALTMLGLLVLGRRLRAGPGGWGLGISLAYAWAAYPYTLFALNCNTNDSVVAVFCVWALVALRSAPLRGALVGLGAAAKFATLALAPLFATSGSRHRWRGAALASVVVLLVVAGSFAPFVPGVGVREVFDRTLGYQTGRGSPFSVWGQHGGLYDLWTAFKVLAVDFAVAVAFVPRRKTPIQVAALGAAILIALQIVVAHWFYLYIVWFTPFVLVALFALHREREVEEDEAVEQPAAALAVA